MRSKKNGRGKEEGEQTNNWKSQRVRVREAESGSQSAVMCKNNLTQQNEGASDMETSKSSSDVT